MIKATALQAKGLRQKRSHPAAKKGSQQWTKGMIKATELQAKGLRQKHSQPAAKGGPKAAKRATEPDDLINNITLY